MDHGEQHITVIDENGDEQLCEVITTFHSDQFNKAYVLYSPIAQSEEEGEVIVHASSFIPNGEGEDGELQPIETEEEWNMLEEVLYALDSEER